MCLYLMMCCCFSFNWNYIINSNTFSMGKNFKFGLMLCQIVGFLYIQPIQINTFYILSVEVQWRARMSFVLHSLQYEFWWLWPHGLRVLIMNTNDQGTWTFYMIDAVAAWRAAHTRYGIFIEGVSAKIVCKKIRRLSSVAKQAWKWKNN